VPALYRFRHTLGDRKLVIELATADDARPLLDIFRACLTEGRWFVSHAEIGRASCRERVYASV
jgi:hypothetical protein